MFVVPPHKPKFYLMRYTGEKIEFLDLESCLVYIKGNPDVAALTGKTFQTKRAEDQFTLERHMENLKKRVLFVIRDDLGNVIDPWARSEVNSYDLVFHRWSGRFRRRSRWYRRPRTTQERRESCSWDDETPAVRPCRNKANLINSWEDKPRTVQRCWKEQRRTRYKV